MSRQHDGDNSGRSSRIPFFQEDSQGGTLQQRRLVRQASLELDSGRRILELKQAIPRVPGRQCVQKILIVAAIPENERDHATEGKTPSRTPRGRRVT